MQRVLSSQVPSTALMLVDLGSMSALWELVIYVTIINFNSTSVLASGSVTVHCSFSVLINKINLYWGYLLHSKVLYRRVLLTIRQYWSVSLTGLDHCTIVQIRSVHNVNKLVKGWSAPFRSPLPHRLTWSSTLVGWSTRIALLPW